CCASRPLFAILLALSLLNLCGCANKNPTPAITAHQMGDFNPPIIVSAHPHQDAAAYKAADEKLSETDWRELEKLGPRPIWEQIEARQHRCENEQMSSATTTQPVRPATMPTTQPEPAEADLPVQRVDLPGNRVRLVWTLRSFGGPTVKSSRDATTARRSVEL